ncbi:MAG: thiamine-phosphate kinase [Proteobacteria bacterium]|nr:thiamine-phosphate kinase [Pseudomonadota bacterium]MBU4468917.1 thiamine-phosphate kinase [Pseudomonadota bacterium]MCG2750910.1 thiamine-phosphate kinase [Desulfobacteraceae bacterium]
MDKTVRMLKNTHLLRFYFITDHAVPGLSALDQVKAAVSGGATLVQYRNKSFSAAFYQEVLEIRNLCKSNGVPFIINDDMVLAKAVGADGVHLGQSDDLPALAREILGPAAILGVSISTLDELKKTDLTPCDYLGAGPVFPTGTKPDAKSVIGLEGLKAVVEASSLPVVAIGGIDRTNARDCFLNGASGISLISAVSRSKNPVQAAKELGVLCDCPERLRLNSPWSDEFLLIDKLLQRVSGPKLSRSRIVIPPGDDAALLQTLSRPVITTDTQRENVHFSFSWQTPEEVGEKAVTITLSDLAASYADPVCLFVNLGLPPSVSDETVEALYAGMEKALLQYDCELGGGNISGADQLSLDLFAVGQARSDSMPLRANAKPGHGLYCTGPLGLARAGLEVLQAGKRIIPELVGRFKSPKARFDAARILESFNVACVMDISDGLAGDAARLAEASGVSIFLELDPKYLHPDLMAWCDSDLGKAMDMALSGGEDYELLFSCLPETFEKIYNRIPEAYPVGKCLAFSGNRIINPPKALSFQHGRKLDPRWFPYKP